MPFGLGFFAIAGAGAGSSPVAAYVIGGRDSTGNQDNKAYKLSFTDDTFSSLPNLASSVTENVGYANSGTAGYYTGGGYSIRSTTYKYAFPADTRTTTTAVAGVLDAVGVSNSGTAGYVMGGAYATDSISTNYIAKVAYSNDSVSGLGATLSASRWNGSGFSNQGVAGYYAGGRTDQQNPVTTVDKLSFTAETRSSLATGLDAARYWHNGFQNHGTAGYVGGGSTAGSPTANVNKFAYSNDSRSVLASGLSQQRIRYYSGSAKNSAGYLMGGYNGGETYYSTTDKWAFPSDTRTTLGTGLPTVRGGGASFSNEGTL
jgi:hypothetical protein